MIQNTKNIKIAGAAIGLFLFICIIPLVLPGSFYFSQLEKHLEERTGLDFEVSGSNKAGFLPLLHLSADQINFRGQAGLGIQIFGDLQGIQLEFNVLELFTGQVNIKQLSVEDANITVNGDFTSYLPDWLRAKLSFAQKTEVRSAELIRAILKDSSIQKAELKQGQIFWNKTESENYRLENLSLKLQKPLKDKDLTLKGQALLNERNVEIAARLQRPDEFMQGFRSKLNVNLSSSPMNITFDGDGALRTSFIAQGKVKVDIPSHRDFCAWLQLNRNCSQHQGNIALEGELKLRNQQLQIANALYENEGRQYRANGTVDFKRHLPNINASITLPVNEKLEYDPVWTALQTTNLHDFLIETYDANIDIRHTGIATASGELIEPRWHIQVKDSRLDLSLPPLKVLGGQVEFSFKWTPTRDSGNALFIGNVKNVDISTLNVDNRNQLELTGLTNLRLEAHAQGRTLQDFAKTLNLNGELRILDGTFGNPEIAHALKTENADTVEFTQLRSSLTAKTGVISVPDIQVIAPASQLTGQGRLDLKDLNMDLQIFGLVNDDQTDIDKKRFVRLQGPLDQLILITPENAKTQSGQMNGLHSGLIPQYDPKDQSSGGDILDE